MRRLWVDSLRYCRPGRAAAVSLSRSDRHCPSASVRDQAFRRFAGGTTASFERKPTASTSCSLESIHIPGVRRSSRTFVTTSVDETFSVPLTLTDVHMHQEQIPLAYFFHETLDADMLESSLKAVLRRFPILGGSVDYSGIPTIECGKRDTVPLCFGWSDDPLTKWLGNEGREHQHLHYSSKHPVLLPLFDDLSKKRWLEDPGDEVTCSLSEHLSTVRVTYFKGGGTALGINLSHMLADASSCVRFVQCWGREMRGLQYPLPVLNERSNATCSGMVSLELAELMNLGSRKDNHQGESESNASNRTLLAAFVPRDIFDGDLKEELYEKGKNGTGGAEHKYVQMPLKPKFLRAMKAYGMAYCNAQSQSDTAFVSTNDMVTAFGWLMKRHLAGKPDWNISMVVNLRGRGGVDGFSDINDANGKSGVFGNALTNTIAKMPARHQNKPSRCIAVDLSEVMAAAVSIRKALNDSVLDIPDRVSLSKMGKPVCAPSGQSFATTSWTQFPLWDVRFSMQDGGKITGFHGHPSHPLPDGETFSSVVVSRRCGGFVFQLLTPSDKAQQAHLFHQRVESLFLDWHEKNAKEEQRSKF